MTPRDILALVAVALAPAVLSLIGHALRLNGRVLAVLVWVGLDRLRGRRDPGRVAVAVSAEEWRPIIGSPGYEVSDLGRVRGIARTVRYRDGQTHRFPERVLKPSANPVSGYLNVKVKGRTRNVHTLVLEAFVGPAPPGMQCRHLNGNAGDARLVNLAWGTRSENNRDQARHGTHHLAKRTHCPAGHLLQAPNLRAATARRGYRGCLACERARLAMLRARVNHGVAFDLDFAEIAAAKYAEIMRGVAT